MDNRKAEVMIEDMCCLLERQTAMALQGDWAGVEALMSQAEESIRQITKLKVNDSASFKEKKNRLKDMYKNLSLIVAGSKDEAFAELTRIRKSKTILGVYKKGAC